MPPEPAASTRELMVTVVTTWRNLLRERPPPTGFQKLMPQGGVLKEAVWISQGHLPMKVPYDRHPVQPLLERLLASDSHLRVTCLDAAKLAGALEVILLDRIVTDPAVLSRGPELDEVVADDLIGKLFSEDYSRALYFRVYNLFMEQPAFPVSPLGASLVALHDDEIPLITGEPTWVSTLHLPNTGNAFLVFEDMGSGNDTDWWRDRWTDANRMIAVLKYLKYGIVDIDYSVIHFTPNWVNHVRKYGIHMWGRPRTDVQAVRFTLSAVDQGTVVRYLNAEPRYRAALQDRGASLRRATATAGNYYEGHHRRTVPEDQLIDLVIALESLFSPVEKTELRFRISLSAALLLGKDPDERRDIMDFIRDMYDHRSALVHGGKSPFVSGELTSAHIARLGDGVREAILRLGVLYVRGQQHRDQVLNEILQGAFSNPLLEDIRKRSDLENFLAEVGL